MIVNSNYVRLTFSVMIIFSLFFYSCSNKGDYPGFLKKYGVNYQLLKFENTDEHRFEPGNYYTADIVYLTMNDSAFFKGRRKLQVFEPEFEGDIGACFKILQTGDSALFIISADDFFEKTIGEELPSFIPKNSNMKVALSILEIQSEFLFQQEKEAFMSWVKDREDYENVNMQQFLQDENVSVESLKSGMYSVIVSEGNDVEISYGDTITIHYEGWFLNGKFFDSTRERKQPFTFVYGTEWQVVAGIEEALKGMKESEKSIFIMPSKLAFGYTGSSTGRIPPFTSVIFEIEVLEVRKNTNSDDNDESRADELLDSINS